MTYKGSARLLENELVKVTPLGLPLLTFDYFSNEYDDTPWRLEQRKLKLNKLYENIRKNKEYI